MSRRRLSIPEWLQRPSSLRGFRGRRVAVVGLGQFGGGLGATHFFAERGAEVLVVDRADADTLSDSLARLSADWRVNLALQCEDAASAVSAFRPEIVCVTPAIRPDAPWLRALRSVVPCVTTEIALFLALCRGRVVGITGSNGKSTTAALTGWVVASGMSAPLVVPQGVELRAAGGVLPGGPLLSGLPLQIPVGWHLACGDSSTRGPTATVPPDQWRHGGPSGFRPSLEWPPLACLEPEAVAAETTRSPLCFLGGNIGGSLLPWVDRVGVQDVVVLELSSFQLMWLRSAHPRVHVAVVTGFAPNHLTWHRTLDEYRRAKQLLLAMQTPHDWAVLAAAPESERERGTRDGDPGRWPVRGGRIVVDVIGDAGVHSSQQQTEAQHGADCTVEVSVRPPLIPRSAETATRPQNAHFRAVWSPGDRHHVAATEGRGLRELATVAARSVPLPGIHNRRNAALAAAAAYALGIVPQKIESAIATFPGMAHRLETVAYVGGVPVIDDSASTTIDSTLAAMHALGDGCVLICGGTSKGADPRPLVAAFARCRAVATIGPAGRELREFWATDFRRRSCDGVRAGGKAPQVTFCETLEQAVSWALERAPGSRAVLFSPGFASYHAFRHYAERGRAFRELVRARLAR